METSFLILSPFFYLYPLFEERNCRVKQWFSVYQIKEYIWGQNICAFSETTRRHIL